MTVSASPRRRAGRVALLAGILALVAAGSLPVTVAAGSDITFAPSVGSCNTSGSAPAGQTFRLIVRGADGTKKHDANVTADGGGAWSISCMNDNIAIGDVFRAKVAGSVVRSFTVPLLTVAGDRDTDVVNGRAPAGSTIDVLARDCLAAGAVCVEGASGIRSVNAQGRWSWDLTSAFDVRGGDEVVISWTSPQGDVARTGSNVPHMIVLVGRSWAYGTTRFTDTLTGTLRRAGSVIGTGKDAGDGRGNVSITFRKNGTVARARVGDVARFDFSTTTETQADAVVPVIATSVAFGPDGQAVTGRCYPDSSGVLYVAGSPFVFTGFTTDGDGDFAGTLATPVAQGDPYDLVCTTRAGDSVVRSGSVPSLAP